MKFAHALQLAGVPQELHASALASLEKAQKASKGIEGHGLRAPVSWATLPGFN